MSSLNFKVEKKAVDSCLDPELFDIWKEMPELEKEQLRSDPWSKKKTFIVLWLPKASAVLVVLDK